MAVAVGDLEYGAPRPPDALFVLGVPPAVLMAMISLIGVPDLGQRMNGNRAVTCLLRGEEGVPGNVVVSDQAGALYLPGVVDVVQNHVAMFIDIPSLWEKQVCRALVGTQIQHVDGESMFCSRSLTGVCLWTITCTWWLRTIADGFAPI